VKKRQTIKYFRFKVKFVGANDETKKKKKKKSSKKKQKKKKLLKIEPNWIDTINRQTKSLQDSKQSQVYLENPSTARQTESTRPTKSIHDDPATRNDNATKLKNNH
jgi:hypothetical protein